MQSPMPAPGAVRWAPATAVDRWPWDAVRRLSSPVLAVAVAIASFVGPLSPPVTPATGVTAPVLVVAGAALAGVATALRDRVRWLLPVTAVLCWGLATMWPAMLLAAYRAGSRQRNGRLWASAAAGTLVTGAPLLIGLSVRRDPRTGVVVSSLFVVGLIWLPMLLGLWLSTRAALVAQLAERAAHAEQERRSHAERARADERASIAREMHDVLAHRVSLMVLHAGVVEVNSGERTTVEAAAVIRQTGSTALTELREILGVLRGVDAERSALLAPQPGLAELDGLLDEARRAGIPVHRRDEGNLDNLPATVARTAYRVVRETLTNVARHAGQVPTTVTLNRTAAQLEVVVANDAAQPPPPARSAGGGFGLIGLRERVALLGGELAAGPRPGGGYRVAARLPIGTVT